MPRDTGIAQRLRDAGLRVTEVAGWQTRGSDSFNPRGCVNHHTAGGANGATPSLNGIINGFSGSAPGPLANAMQSREPDGNDIFYVVAAGKANHAGEGGWHGLSGNSSVYGLEIEHTGTVPLPEARQRLAARFHAAVLAGKGDASMVCQHFEWAPTRKIDAATSVDPDVFRSWVADAMTGKREPPQQHWEAQEMFAVQDTEGGIYLAGPGVWKHLNGDEWGAWQRFLPPLAPAVNGVQRDWIRDVCVAMAAQNTWASPLNSRIDAGAQYAAGDILTATEADARAAATGDVGTHQHGHHHRHHDDGDE
jgi:hypothetical protein